METRLSPRTSLNEIAVPPKMSPLLVTPTLIGGRPSRNSRCQLPFFSLFSAMSVWLSGAWKSMIGPGAPKSAVAADLIGLASYIW